MFRLFFFFLLQPLTSGYEHRPSGSVTAEEKASVSFCGQFKNVSCITERFHPVSLLLKGVGFKAPG